MDTETLETSADPAEAQAKYWTEQLEHSEKTLRDWQVRADRVVTRYRDERDGVEKGKSKFNILWSNIQVLKPSLYGRQAKPEVSRRYMDTDPVSRLASTMLERVLDYEVQQFPDFHFAMTACVEDRLLPGRGTAWMTFEPEGEEVDKAHSPVNYVYWKDFFHSPARTWDEVWWVARCVYLSREKGVARFGEIFNQVKLHEYKEENYSSAEKKESPYAKTAKVYEIWDKSTGKVCWVAKDFPKALDEVDDPLKLEGFFPCPKPLYATTTNGSLVPIPDYSEYQDQAQEIDDLTERIDELVDAVRVAGVYNGEFKELERLFKTRGNKLIPVTSWGAFAEKQGLKGAVDFLDITVIGQSLGMLYNAREAAKQTIYEVCGISDIIRGTTKAEETLGAQQLKANFGSLRLRSSQQDVARFASDIFRLKAQVVCSLYPDALIVEMSGVANTQDGQDPKLLAGALALLKNSTVRDFHIEVESDTLAQLDDAAEKEEANELLTALGGFFQQSLEAVSAAPALLPVVEATLKLILSRNHAGRNLEAAVDQSFAALKQQAAQNAVNPPPSKEQIQAQLQQQSEQMRIAADTQAAQMKAEFDAQTQERKLAMEAQLEQAKAQLEERRMAFEMQFKQQESQTKAEIEKWKAQLDAATKLRIAEIQAQSAANTAQISAAASKETAAMSSETSKETAKIGAESSQKVAALGAGSKMAVAALKPAQPGKSTPAETNKGAAEVVETEDELKPIINVTVPEIKMPEIPAPKVNVTVEPPKRAKVVEIVRDEKGRMKYVREIEDIPA